MPNISQTNTALFALLSFVICSNYTLNGEITDFHETLPFLSDLVYWNIVVLIYIMYYRATYNIIKCLPLKGAAHYTRRKQIFGARSTSFIDHLSSPRPYQLSPYPLVFHKFPYFMFYFYFYWHLFTIFVISVTKSVVESVRFIVQFHKVRCPLW